MSVFELALDVVFSYSACEGGGDAMKAEARFGVACAEGFEGFEFAKEIERGGAKAELSIDEERRRVGAHEGGGLGVEEGAEVFKAIA